MKDKDPATRSETYGDPDPNYSAEQSVQLEVSICGDLQMLRGRIDGFVNLSPNTRRIEEYKTTRSAPDSRGGADWGQVFIYGAISLRRINPIYRARACLYPSGYAPRDKIQLHLYASTTRLRVRIDFVVVRSSGGAPSGANQLQRSFDRKS